MQQHIYYTKYALQFAGMQIPELVTIFNAQVQNRGWSSMRAYHNQALIDEFQRRGIDVSAVYDGKVIRFAHSVRYDLPNNKLVVINWPYTNIAFAVCSCIGGVFLINYLKGLALSNSKKGIRNPISQK